MHTEEPPQKTRHGHTVFLGQSKRGRRQVRSGKERDKQQQQHTNNRQQPSSEFDLLGRHPSIPSRQTAPVCHRLAYASASTPSGFRLPLHMALFFVVSSRKPTLHSPPIRRARLRQSRFWGWGATRNLAPAETDKGSIRRPRYCAQMTLAVLERRAACFCSHRRY